VNDGAREIRLSIRFLKINTESNQLLPSLITFYIICKKKFKHIVMNENEVGPKVGADMPIKNQGHVTQDLPEDKRRKSTRIKFVSSKLREFE